MSHYPGAAWRPVDRYQAGELHVPMTARRLILHTAVSNATPSMQSFFNVRGRATPHFYVGRDGEVEQYIDTGYRGSANLDGNWNAIGVETWDGYVEGHGTGSPSVGGIWNGGSPGPRWTDAQVQALGELAAWCYLEHGIPLHPLHSSRRLGRGVGWHRLGNDGNFSSEFPFYGRKPFGEHWSLSFGKPCPTDTRITQVIHEVLPRARRIITTPVDKPAVETKDQGRVQHAVHDLRAARRAMKPGKRRNKVIAALRLIRGLLATKTANSRPHEDSN